MINVLVVEDDPMVACLHERYLSQVKGFMLAGVVRNGSEALEKLKERNFDLLILDVFMPGMDGLQLLTKIREIGYDADVIIVSAANDKDKIKLALRMGAVDYIIKPFEFDRFRLALDNYRLRHHLVEQQEVIDQTELDCTIIRHERYMPVTLPKGLDKLTLEMAWEKICEYEGYFTTEEAARITGLSRVSVRKYLEFLTGINLLKLDLQRGNIGRPVYKYHCLDKKSDVLDAYVN